jgi:hypothetical protein
MKLFKFCIVPLSIIRNYSLYIQQWYMSYTFLESFRAGSGWNCSSILILLPESCLQTCMTHTIADCTVNNSWWWTEELYETCRVSFQKKIEKLVHLVCFIIRKVANSFPDPSFSCQFVLSILIFFFTGRFVTYAPFTGPPKPHFGLFRSSGILLLRLQFWKDAQL